MLARSLTAAFFLLSCAAHAALAQGVSASSPRGLQRVVVPPAVEGEVKDLQARIAALEQELRRRGIALEAGPSGGIGGLGGIGERKAALPPPPPKEEVPLAPSALAAGPAAAGLAVGGLGLPALGLLGGALVGAAIAAGSGGSATASTSTR